MLCSLMVSHLPQMSVPSPVDYSHPNTNILFFFPFCFHLDIYPLAGGMAPSLCSFSKASIYNFCFPFLSSILPESDLFYFHSRSQGDNLLKVIGPVICP